MKETNHGLLYHAQEKWSLLKLNFLTLLLFESIYTLIGSLIVYPGGSFLFKKGMNLLGFSYLSSSNISQIIASPFCLVTIFCLLLLFGFFGLFELTTLILLFNESHFRRKIQLIPLCKEVFLRALNIFKPKNFPLIIFVLLIIPFTEFSLSSSFITEIRIPEFIMRYIMSNPSLILIYGGVTLILVLLVIFWIFSLHYFTLEKENFFQAIKKSRTLIKGHFWHTVFYVALWEMIIFGMLLAVFFLLETITSFSLRYLMGNILALSIFIGSFGFFVSILFTIFSLISTSINFALVSMFYYDFSAISNLKIQSISFIERMPTFKLQKKAILILSFLIIYLIILINSFTIYIEFNTLFKSSPVTDTQIIAHRGSFTLTALQKSIDEGADFAETDVGQIKGGDIIFSHDNNIKLGFM